MKSPWKMVELSWQEQVGGGRDRQDLAGAISRGVLAFILTKNRQTAVVISGIWMGSRTGKCSSLKEATKNS